ncbi:type II toxin-antitoxin system HicA family toxin [Xanthobacter flavus]|uniref:type II toxin-antitoxin system HicA family toxin n=1 Tax=Xanthobacter flavus TaxID=281 RepID=UPI0024907201|nr:type II toxin-antitoxin system HicA family toxin [Xanthobacter flavus]
MPRLKCTFREFIEVLLAAGFEEIRQEGSHRRYRGVVNSEVRLVTVAYHNIGDDILLRTLESMIRQSGLPKKSFRK